MVAVFARLRLVGEASDVGEVLWASNGALVGDQMRLRNDEHVRSVKKTGDPLLPGFMESLSQ